MEGRGQRISRPLLLRQAQHVPGAAGGARAAGQASVHQRAGRRSVAAPGTSRPSQGRSHGCHGPPRRFLPDPRRRFLAAGGHRDVQAGDKLRPPGSPRHRKEPDHQQHHRRGTGAGQEGAVRVREDGRPGGGQGAAGGQGAGRLHPGDPQPEGQQDRGDGGASPVHDARSRTPGEYGRPQEAGAGARRDQRLRAGAPRCARTPRLLCLPGPLWTGHAARGAGPAHFHPGQLLHAPRGPRRTSAPGEEGPGPACPGREDGRSHLEGPAHRQLEGRGRGDLGVGPEGA
ncbi:MAG: hypothetical protein A4E29_00050 [Methanomassiliicoccales archaeon PtaB.Bin134]|nr:MAG: hypothetical protein A4E29_00050 [Methanomassiliicoccales archaeon PtaB.Bin134]